MRLWLLAQITLALSTSFMALPALAENVKIPAHYLPKVEYYMAPLEIQITGEQPNVKDLRQQETADKYVMHIGEATPIPPPQIRPTAKPPVVREWGLPPAGFQSYVGDQSSALRKADMPPLVLHKTPPGSILTRRPAAAPASVALKTTKPVPIASVYEPYSQTVNNIGSVTKTAARGKLLK